VTSFAWSGAESREPRVDLWTCRVDGHLRIQMADVTDAEALCRTILDKAKGSEQLNGHYEDALGLMRAELWDLYRRWDPSRGVRFTSYATGLLRMRVANVWRYELGRDTQKAHVGAVSLDALVDQSESDGPSLGGLVASSEGDPGLDRSPDLARALAQGGRGTAQPLPPRDRRAAAAGVRQRGLDRLPDAAVA
jgi:hypothetical protein